MNDDQLEDFIVEVLGRWTVVLVVGLTLGLNISYLCGWAQLQ